MDTKRVENILESMENNMSPTAGYMPDTTKIKLVKSIDKVSEEIRTRNKELKKYVVRAMDLKSMILSMQNKIDRKTTRNRLHSKFADYLLNTRWHILEERGYDVEGESWTLPKKRMKEGKKEEKEEKEEGVKEASIPSDLFEDMGK